MATGVRLDEVILVFPCVTAEVCDLSSWLPSLYYSLCETCKINCLKKPVYAVMYLCGVFCSRRGVVGAGLSCPWQWFGMHLGSAVTPASLHCNRKHWGYKLTTFLPSSWCLKFNMLLICTLLLQAKPSECYHLWQLMHSSWVQLPVTDYK